MESNPLISIIIPCYNQAQFLDEALQSVLNQTYTNWECIIMNDGSTDDSEKIAKNWATKDTRFKYFYQVNSGVSAARNHALAKAKGIYIQFLDADDLIATDKISISIDAIQKYDVAVVCSNYFMFKDEITNLLPTFSQLEDFEFNFYNLARYWNDGFTVPIHCWFFKASLLENIQFPAGLTAQEDWVMWLLIFNKSPKTYYISKQLAFYRSNPKGRTKTEGFFNETLKAINYLKPLLKAHDFQVLYEAVIVRYNSQMLYWKNREKNLKHSNTYQFGLICKKVLIKMGLLPVAKTIFQYINPLK